MIIIIIIERVPSLETHGLVGSPSAGILIINRRSRGERGHACSACPTPVDWEAARVLRSASRGSISRYRYSARQKETRRRRRTGKGEGGGGTRERESLAITAALLLRSMVANLYDKQPVLGVPRVQTVCIRTRTLVDVPVNKHPGHKRAPPCRSEPSLENVSGHRVATGFKITFEIISPRETTGTFVLRPVDSAEIFSAEKFYRS